MTQVLKRANQVINRATGQADIILEVEGVPYQNFKSVMIHSSFEDMSRYFQAILTMDDFETFPIKQDNRVSIKIEGTHVFTGFIEEIEKNDTNDGTDIIISGRDKLADVLDSSLIEQVSFSAPKKLRDIILNVLNNNNIEAKIIPSRQSIRGKIGGFIGIIDEAEPEDYSKGDLIESEVGENIFEFLNKYATRSQVILSSDGFGNLLITRGGRGGTFKTGLIRRHISTPANVLDSIAGGLLPRKTRENNILSSKLNYDNSQRFHLYRFITQQNAGSLASLLGEINMKSLTGTRGEARDSNMRKSRSMVISMDSSRSSPTAIKRATWEANIRRIRSRSYTCSVQGFKAESDNALWEVNRIVQINDEKNDMKGPMLISAVTYKFDEAGSITTLQLTDPDAYTVQANISKSELKTAKSGFNIQELLGG